MALSGSFGNTFTTGYRLQVDWSATQDISANTSTITANLYLISLGSSYTISSSATKTGSQTIDGVSNSFSTAGASLSGNQKKLLNTYVRTVSHNADGTKSLSMSAVYNIAVTLGGTYYSSVSCSSGTITLDTIPRASDLTSGRDWTAGTQNLAVTISRATTSFHHSVEVRVQKPDGTWVYIGVRDNIQTSTTFTFSLSENTSIYQSISQYEYRPSWVRLITFDSSNNMIGYKDYYGTVYGAGIAKISFNNFNIGDSISATLSGMQNYTGFEYTGIFKVAGTTIKTFTFDKATPNVTLTFTSAEITQMYNLTPNSNSVSGQVTVTSKYNGVDINDGLPAPTYDPNFNFTAYVTNSNPTFTAGSISYADVNSTMATLTGNNQYIVQNKSSLTAYVNTQATAKNGATFTKYVVTVNGKQGEIATATGNVNIGAITAGTDQTLSVKAYDSRGNFTELILTVKVVPYADPSVAVSLDRLNKFDSNTVLKVSGSFSVLNVNGSNKNTINTITYHYREKGTSTWGSDASMTFTISGATFTATNKTISLDNTKAWEFEVMVNDKVETFTVPASVGAGQPIFFIDSVKSSVGVNKFPSASNSFEVQGTMDVTGSVTLNNTLGVTGATTLSSALTANGVTTIGAGGETLKIKAGATADQVLMGFYADSQAQNTRSGWIGYGSAGTVDMSITNQMSGGDIILTANTDITLVPTAGKLTLTTNTLELNPKAQINTGFELGSQTLTSPAYSFIDFHSSQYANDYDGRIIMYGGNSGQNGMGTMTFYAGGFTFSNGYIDAQLKHNSNYLIVGAFGSSYGTGHSRIWYDSNGNALNFWNQSNAYITLKASAFTVSSQKELKVNIMKDTSSALGKVNSTSVYDYHFISDLEVYEQDADGNWFDTKKQKDPTKVKKRKGLILEEAPSELVMNDGIDLYAMSSMLWRAVQELSEQVQELSGKIDNKTKALDEKKMDKPETTTQQNK